MFGKFKIMNSKNRKNTSKKNQLLQKKPTQKVEKNNTNKWIWFALSVVLITTFAIYLNAIKFDLFYLWDDRIYITDNSYIKNLYWSNIKFFITSFYANNYHPITMLMYALEYKIFGDSALHYHLNNIILHILNTFLVFVLIRKISPKNAVVALITAGFFAVHPMHVESVAWVSERKDVLYSLFFLLSLIMYTNYLKSQKTKHIIFVFIFFLLSCLSKSAAVITPLIMLLFDYYFNRKYNLKMILEKVPFFAVSILFGVIAIYSQKGSLQELAPNMSLIEHISIVSFSFISYLYKAFIPVNLSALYPYPIELGNTLPIMYYLSILCVGLLLFFIWYSQRWGKDVVFGMMFFIITIILVLQFIPVGAATMADRYTYIPYIGIFYIIGKFCERFFLQPNANFIKYKSYSLILLVLGFIVFSAITYGRVKIWENDNTLFSDVINKYPNCSTAYLNRGVCYSSYYAEKVYANDSIKREMYFKKSIQDFENVLNFAMFTKDNWKVYDNLASAKGKLGDIDEAVKDYSKSIELNPNNRNSYINRGVYFLNYYANKVYVNEKIKREVYVKRSIEDFESTLKLTFIPIEKVQVYNNLGIAKITLGDFTGAIGDCEKSIIINANDANAYNIRGNARFNLKNYEGALEDYNKVIALNPGDANAIKNIDVVKTIMENAKK